MASVVLTLGPITFEGFEIPSAIDFGGRQLIAVHRLTDGRRVVDSIGPDETEITFSGAFTGSDATLRARLLNSLRVAGCEISLTWDIYYYTVVLSRFDVSYQNPVWIPYKICCTVVRDESAVACSFMPSLYDSLLSDIESAASSCASLGSYSADLRIALTTSDATTPGTAAFMAAQLGLSLMQSSIDAQMASEEIILQNSLSSSLTVTENIIRILDISTDSAQQLAELTEAKAHVGRAIQSLLNAST